MNPIKFECPHCHEIISGDESLYGQQVKCRQCQATILVPQAPASAVPQTARLIQEPAASAPIVPDEAKQETNILKLSPVARAFPGQILLAVIFIGLAIGLAIRAQDFSWPRWVALVPLALGLLLLLLGWLAKPISSVSVVYAVGGFFVGGILGFLFRPSVLLVGQLPFSTVIMRGASLQGMDKMLIPAAQSSFNVMVAVAIVGTLIGAGIGHYLSTKQH